MAYDMIDKDARTWAMLCHLAALAGLMFPFGNVVGPLVVWLVKRDEHPYIDAQGREALNFQLSVALYTLLCIPLIFVIIGIPMLILLCFAGMVLAIVAGIRANDGVGFRYPLTIRLF